MHFYSQVLLPGPSFSGDLQLLTAVQILRVITFLSTLLYMYWSFIRDLTCFLDLIAGTINLAHKTFNLLCLFGSLCFSKTDVH